MIKTLVVVPTDVVKLLQGSIHILASVVVSIVVENVVKSKAFELSVITNNISNES